MAGSFGITTGGDVRIMLSVRMMMVPLLIGMALIVKFAEATEPSQCEDHIEGDTRYVVCRFDVSESDIRVFHSDETGRAYGGFNQLVIDLKRHGQQLVFAMNGGMYHQDRSPVGLYIENGTRIKKANTNDGPGNFHLKPNGVFYVMGDGTVGVLETGVYLKADLSPRYATQSGPMLVIDGELHHRFIPNSPSAKIRNGVGVTMSGDVFFVKSDSWVNFHTFALFFRDRLNARNALFLDGSISRIYVPELNRNDVGARMGPIVGVVAR